MKKDRPHASVNRDEAAMTWADIGEALGYRDRDYGRKVAFMFYRNAMKKIRKNPRAVAKLKELVEFRNSQRRASTPMPDWEE